MERWPSSAECNAAARDQCTELEKFTSELRDKGCQTWEHPPHTHLSVFTPFTYAHNHKYAVYHKALVQFLSVYFPSKSCIIVKRFQYTRLTHLNKALHEQWSLSACSVWLEIKATLLCHSLFCSLNTLKISEGALCTHGQCVDISQVHWEHNPDSVSSLDLFVMNSHLGSAAWLVSGQEKECF